MDAKYLKSEDTVKNFNHYWIIEEHNSSGRFVPCDAERTRKRARELIKLYKSLYPNSKYRIRQYYKFVSE